MTKKERPDLVWVFLLPEHLAALNAGQAARLDIPADPGARPSMRSRRAHDRTDRGS